MPAARKPSKIKTTNSQYEYIPLYTRVHNGPDDYIPSHLFNPLPYTFMKKDSTQIYQDDVDWNSPDKILMEKEEPLLNANEYRKASLHFVRIMSLAMSYIIESRDSLAAAYGVSYALGLNTADRSMRQVGRELNLSSGTISAHSKRFRLLTGLPPSLAQQPIKRADNSRKAINKKLQ